MTSTRWTTEQIGDLSGRRVLVTGGNSGIGLEAARVLAGHGASVVIACRNLDKGEQAAQAIRSTVADADVELLQLDLADLASVEAAADDYLARSATLDVLVNNAGVMALPYRATVDGFEMQFGTNHLGHFALTGRLMPALLATPNARVVTVSSFMHRGGRMDFGNLDAANGYSKWPAYSMSKLANLLFTCELQRRAEQAGAALTAVAAHPGYSRTHLQSAGPTMAGSRIALAGWKVLNLIGQSASRGALPTIYAATSPDMAGGDYAGPNGLGELRGNPVKVKMTRAARNRDDAARLWAVSEELTGVRYEGLGGAG